MVKNLINGALETDIDVSEILCPVLLIAGDEDLLTPVKYLEDILTKCKSGKLEVVNSDNASLIEKPQIMESVLPWLSKILT